MDDQELRDVAGSAEHARLLRNSLQELADGKGGDVLQEMAQEVISGRVGLREAVQFSAYAEALGEKMREFMTKVNELTPEEREMLREEADKAVESQQGMGWSE